MTNIQISTPVYIAGAIFGLVMVVTSLVLLFVQPSDVVHAAQNNVSAIVVMGTPTPCVVADYVVRADACQR